MERVPTLSKVDKKEPKAKKDKIMNPLRTLNFKESGITYHIYSYKNTLVRIRRLDNGSKIFPDKLFISMEVALKHIDCQIKDY